VDGGRTARPHAHSTGDNPFLTGAARLFSLKHDRAAPGDGRATSANVSKFDPEVSTANNLSSGSVNFLAGRIGIPGGVGRRPSCRGCPARGRRPRRRAPIRSPSRVRRRQSARAGPGPASELCSRYRRSARINISPPQCYWPACRCAPSGTRIRRSRGLLSFEPITNGTPGSRSATARCGDRAHAKKFAFLCQNRIVARRVAMRLHGAAAIHSRNPMSNKSCMCGEWRELSPHVSSATEQRPS
jgi:hypothetical protein